MLAAVGKRVDIGPVAPAQHQEVFAAILDNHGFEPALAFALTCEHQAADGDVGPSCRRAGDLRRRGVATGFGRGRWGA